MLLFIGCWLLLFDLAWTFVCCLWLVGLCLIVIGWFWVLGFMLTGLINFGVYLLVIWWLTLGYFCVWLVLYLLVCGCIMCWLLLYLRGLLVLWFSYLFVWLCGCCLVTLVFCFLCIIVVYTVAGLLLFWVFILERFFCVCVLLFAPIWLHLRACVVLICVIMFVFCRLVLLVSFCWVWLCFRYWIQYYVGWLIICVCCDSFSVVALCCVYSGSWVFCA